ncbi:hypothetical protein DSM112329_03003 [Paraconexibacter sp. AEG42_29]|uniref:Thioredoxin domain-containing protein n=1 Tax=Paraconexibacter sp. AEG42_29 TaxID=2997339 RepID=A0AAU7AWS4_9ACTN
MLRACRSATLAGAVLLTLAAAGCGSSEDGDGKAPPAQPAPTAAAQDFPKPAGKSLGALQAGMAEGPVLSPTVSVLTPGRNRFGFGLFDVARKEIAGAGAALYIADADGSHVRGPYIARSESLVVKPQFESRTTSQDPDSAKSVYVADVPFTKTGKYLVLAVARVDGRLLATSQRSMEVLGSGNTPPKVGDRAPRIHTPTLASVAGDATKITTRVPPDVDLLKTDFADVLGKKPIVLVFATPQLCVSRVCGPVVDIAAQVGAAVGSRVAFIHQEIFNDNDASKGYRPQLRAYRLPSEPWFFVVDKAGRVAARFEGAVSVGELQRAVAKVTPR